MTDCHPPPNSILVFSFFPFSSSTYPQPKRIHKRGCNSTLQPQHSCSAEKCCSLYCQMGVDIPRSIRPVDPSWFLGQTRQTKKQTNKQRILCEPSYQRPLPMPLISILRGSVCVCVCWPLLPCLMPCFERRKPKRESLFLVCISTYTIIQYKLFTL